MAKHTVIDNVCLYCLRGHMVCWPWSVCCTPESSLAVSQPISQINCQVGNMGPCTYICVGDSLARAGINSQMKQSSLSMRILIMVTPYSTYTCAVINQDWSFPTPCRLSPALAGAVLMQHIYVYQCVHGICVCIDYACNVCTEICMHAHLSTTPACSWCACGVDAVVQRMLPY